MLSVYNTSLWEEMASGGNMCHQSDDQNRRKEGRHFALVFALLILLVLILAAANLMTGSVPLTLPQILDALCGKGDASSAAILFDLRLPRLLSAMILGGALAVSGYLLQTFFNNPLAGPFVLGVSSGAKLLVAIALIVALEHGLLLNSWGMIGAAFLGSTLSMLFLLVVSGFSSASSVLIISGVLIGYFCSAVTEIFLTFSKDTNIVSLHTWSQGSFSGISWSNVAVMSIVAVCAGVFCVLLAKPMEAWQMGEAYAMNLGVNISALRLGLILLSSLLSACVTAFAGPVAFVGIAVPHLMRSLLKSARVLLLLPACFLGGSVFCLFADLIARNLFAPTELSISVVTSVLGAPVVILIMLRRQERRRDR